MSSIGASNFGKINPSDNQSETKLNRMISVLSEAHWDTASNRDQNVSNIKNALSQQLNKLSNKELSNFANNLQNRLNTSYPKHDVGAIRRMVEILSQEIRQPSAPPSQPKDKIHDDSQINQLNKKPANEAEPVINFLDQ